MKKTFCLVFAGLFLMQAAACAQPIEPDLSAYGTAAPAEIPMEILGELDEETLADLVEEPKYVALTFDDGPRADTTSELLDGLLERGAAATFFVVGEQVPHNECLIRRMKSEGHQIGNHTYSHVRLKTADKDSVVEEIQKSEVLLREASGEGSFWLRPPYGAIDSQKAKLIKTPMIYWSVDPQDWKLLDSQKVVDAVLSTVQPGDIILLHDFYPTSVAAALEIIDRLREDGYAFVTVEELFRIQGVTPQPGVLYARPDRVRTLS
ncbi:MAG: polysaccharide deacetylase family protein [Oscillospiraceae bacterium]|nr:polysaccharide deacetylase family protein [Oscillospiraceae bacterium]